MLENIRLLDFVIVEAAEIDFAAGFCALTGETGAGKSILIDALGYALGSRVDTGTIREGAPRADIAATFTTDASLEHWLTEHELAGDEGRVLLRRIIEADGRSKAFVNGHPTTAAMLREIGTRLLEVHGQHASQSLLRPEGQRALLDAHAGLGPLDQEVGRDWTRVRNAQRALEAAEADEREIQLERERLAWQFEELARVEPRTGEWETLGADHKRLASAAELIAGADQASTALSGADDAVAGTLHRVIARLRPLATTDSQLASTVELLESAAIQVDEAASELANYASRIDLDPQRLEAIDARLGALHSIARKLRLDPTSLAEELLRLEEALARLDEARDQERLRAELAAAWADYDAAAARLSAGRRRAHAQLEREVSETIRSFGMTGASLEIRIEASDPGPAGRDRVEFLVASHAGARPRPLGRVASGGELSRVALAIAVSTARANPVPTLIFDEADAGTGGMVAGAIGAQMRALGQSCQVLCVTHLPQVAARAHHQYRITKLTRGRKTSSRIEKVEGEARVTEIARMLGGAGTDGASHEHAREMLRAPAG